MPADERALAIQEDLKLVLGVLNMRYPNFVPGETVYRTVMSVSTEYTKHKLIRDMTYLNEKGYVKYRGLHGLDAANITVNACAFALTYHGFEIANRLAEDKTINV